MSETRELILNIKPQPSVLILGEKRLIVDESVPLSKTPPSIQASHHFENYRRVTCPACGSHHILFLVGTNPYLPESLLCALCRARILPNAFQERMTRREEIRQQVILYPSNQEATSAQAIDFSPSGLKISAPLQIDPLNKIRIVCDQFIAMGETVWLRKEKRLLYSQYEMGIRFDYFLPQERSLLIHRVI